MEGTVVDTPDMRRLLLDLFTDVAVLEHLVRARMRPHTAGLEAQHFGVVTYFLRSGKKEEPLATLAWSFQVEEAAMRATVEALAARGYLDLDGACVRPRAEGFAWHASVIDSEADEFLEIMAEFPVETLRQAAATLREIRRTFDNLPDR